MNFSASLTLTQAQRIMPGAPFRILVPLPRIARHLCPRQSRGPGGSNKMVAALAHRLMGGLRLLAKRPTATATRMAPGNKAPNQ
jgi:hypothetical protein